MLETLATLVVLSLIFAALAQFMTTISNVWGTAAGDPFAEAQEAFESVSRNVALATLEPYEDYADATGAFRSSSGGTFAADHLARRSDLDFVCGPSGGPNGLLAGTGRTTAAMGIFFSEPNGLTQTYSQSGLNRLVNALGYFVEFGGDANAPGFFTGTPRQRWRLKQVVQPSESLHVFITSTSASWIAQMAGSAASPSILAENVIALVVLPERSASDSGTAIAPNFAYDSRNAGDTVTYGQLPPRVRLVLAAIDETSACHLAAASGTNPPMLLPSGIFQNASNLDSDIASLDAALTNNNIRHRIYQREISVATAAWSNNS